MPPPLPVHPDNDTRIGPLRTRHPSLADSVYASLCVRIQDGSLPVGTKLPRELELMRAEGVSRTVVREALLKLQAAGLIETRAGIGSFVIRDKARSLDVETASATTFAEVLSILELRICIETESAAFAAQRATADDLQAMRDALTLIDTLAQAGKDAAAADFAFHMRIAHATRNNYLIEVLSQMDPTILPRAHLDPERYVNRVNHEHIDIFAAIERGDADGARTAMRMHLIKSRERLKRASGVA